METTGKPPTDQQTQSPEASPTTGCSPHRHVIHCICPQCGETWDNPGESTGYRTATCPQCGEKSAERWFSMACPPEFRETNVTRLDQRRLGEALGWKPGPGQRNLVLAGPTGSGKTRTAWAVLRALKVDLFEAFDCVGFSRALGIHYKSGNAEEWLLSISTCPLVFFDDLGKLKFTDRVESELFGIVDYRCSHHLPIIATTEDTGETLASRMSPGRGPSFVRRLREFSKVINFSKS